MTTPFSGEDLVKRSLFSSILGLKIRSPRFAHLDDGQSQQPCSSRHAAFHGDNEQQPCSSQQLYHPAPPLHNPNQYGLRQDGYFDPYDDEDVNDGCGRERSLSDQLADELFVATPTVELSTPPTVNHLMPGGSAAPTPSSNDIYQQIVCECRELEKSSEPARLSDELTLLEPLIVTEPAPSDARVTSPLRLAPVTLFTPSPTFITCPNCHHGIDATQLSLSAQQSNAQSPVMVLTPPPPLLPLNSPTHIPQPRGVISLEEVVKMVVSAVKESGMVLTGRSTPAKTLEYQSPEDILERKRIQNNEAAARYRRRQRNAKAIAEGEISALVRRNNELRHEIEAVRKEIQKLRKQLAPSRGTLMDDDTSYGMAK